MSNDLRDIFRLCLILLACAGITACNGGQKNHLQQIQKKGVLRVASLAYTETFFEKPSDIQRFDYELATTFAQQLGVEILFESLPSTSELLQKLEAGEIDLATTIHVTPQRQTNFAFGPRYIYLRPTVVHLNNKPPRSNVRAPVFIGKNANYSEFIQNRPDLLQQFNWQTHTQDNTPQLLEKLVQGQIEFVLLNNISLAQHQQQYPQLRKAFELNTLNPIAWATSRHQDPSLLAEVIAFFGQNYQNGTMTDLKQKYFGKTQLYNFPGLNTFLRRVRTKLPQYTDLFKRHAGELDWRLLAAIAYQESHWDPRARSPTGVRGLMMLTQMTAQYLGIKNRLDPEQSVQGGARFLHQILKRLPKSIPKHERIWFALAAYNMGYGHLMDIRKITQRLGQNPNAWMDVNSNLHLLHQPKWYEKTRHGFARGRQARIYVTNIQLFYQSLLHLNT